MPRSSGLEGKFMMFNVQFYSGIWDWFCQILGICK